MINVLAVALIMVVGVVTMHGQSGCCAPTGTQVFADLGTGAAFRDAHLEPEAAPVPMEGEKMQIRVPGGENTWVRMFKADGTPKATIIVIHEWWGLNEHITKAARTLFEDLGQQADVICVDLYDGFATNKRDEAAKAMQSVKEDRAEAILQAVINSARAEKIGTIGWCFGGGWSLRTSLMAGPKAGACVIYYGMPVKDVDQLKKLNAPVLGVFGSKDQWITTSVVDEFQANMMSAEKMLSVKMYAADHAFANPSNPQYDKAATADAWENTIEFFQLHLLQ